MKAFTALILASIIVCVSIIASPALASYEPSVGVKEGDWIEYEVSIAGVGSPPPTHDVRWFRMKGNYFVHEITMLIVICAWWAGVSLVVLMDPFSGSTEIFFSTPLRLVMNSLHAIFSIPALIFGTWLVALWRPGSTSFAAKSRRIAQLTTVFWVPSYVVGVLDFMVLHTTFFG